MDERPPPYEPAAPLESGPPPPYSSQPHPPHLPPPIPRGIPPPQAPYPQGYPAVVGAPQPYPYHAYGAIPPQAGQVPGAPPFERKPDNYFLLSIATIFCFCIICGLVAMVYSMKVDSAYQNRDYNRAKRNSKLARNWNIAGMLTGFIILFVVTILSSAASAAAKAVGSSEEQ